jgi:hypothetical protein
VKQQKQQKKKKKNEKFKMLISVWVRPARRHTQVDLQALLDRVLDHLRGKSRRLRRFNVDAFVQGRNVKVCANIGAIGDSSADKCTRAVERVLGWVGLTDDFNSGVIKARAHVGIVYYTFTVSIELGAIGRVPTRVSFYPGSE